MYTVELATHSIPLTTLGLLDGEEEIEGKKFVQ